MRGISGFWVMGDALKRAPTQKQVYRSQRLDGHSQEGLCYCPKKQNAPILSGRTFLREQVYHILK
jgi:hypothetical protein